MDEDETDEAIASIAPLDGSFEAVGDTDLIEETVVSLNKDDDKLDENNNEDQQEIRIADASPAGWGTVREYESNAVASDSEDERKIRQAETRAIRTSKEKSKSRQQPYPNKKNTPRQQPAESYGNPAYAQHYQRNQQQPFRGSFARREPCSIDTCHYCKQQGHWRKNCPLLASLRSSNSNSTTYQK
ncbi:uncharacterized protein LOC143084259 [Mytilus galloprovincialis]|uniref:uncharacterized protein LOC143084259 n=1 Tax=Mytilus galloprovincialis TaxID=29158 RepID=UPI003F7BA5F8